MVATLAKDEKQTTGFGKRLRTLRLAKGLTQEALGELVGMRYQVVAKYERGAIEPGWPVVIKLADALGVDVGEFREGDDQGDDTDPPAPPAKRPRK